MDLVTFMLHEQEEVADGGEPMRSRKARLKFEML